MKKLLLGLLTMFCFSQAFADTCREQLEEKLLLRNVVGGATTTVSAIPVASILIGASVGAGPAIFPVAIGTTVVGGAYWVISTRKPARLIKLIDQAQSCKGRLINRAYRVYVNTHTENQRLTKEEFCSDITISNRDGSLCPSGSVPTIKNVGRYFID